MMLKRSKIPLKGSSSSSPLNRGVISKKNIFNSTQPKLKVPIGHENPFRKYPYRENYDPIVIKVEEQINIKKSLLDFLVIMFSTLLGSICGGLIVYCLVNCLPPF
jgi:hypothetical protein